MIWKLKNSQVLLSFNCLNLLPPKIKVLLFLFKIRREKEGGKSGGNDNFDDLANQGKKKRDPINIFDDTNQANEVPTGFTGNEENKDEDKEDDKLKPSSDEFIKTFEQYRDNPMKIYQLLFQ